MPYLAAQAVAGVIVGSLLAFVIAAVAAAEHLLFTETSSCSKYSANPLT